MFRLLSSLRIGIRSFKNAWKVIGSGAIKPSDRVLLKFDWYVNDERLSDE